MQSAGAPLSRAGPVRKKCGVAPLPPCAVRAHIQTQPCRCGRRCRPQRACRTARLWSWMQWRGCASRRTLCYARRGRRRWEGGEGAHGVWQLHGQGGGAVAACCMRCSCWATPTLLRRCHAAATHATLPPPHAYKSSCAWSSTMVPLRMRHPSPRLPSCCACHHPPHPTTTALLPGQAVPGHQQSGPFDSGAVPDAGRGVRAAEGHHRARQHDCVVLPLGTVHLRCVHA